VSKWSSREEREGTFDINELYILGCNCDPFSFASFNKLSPSRALLPVCPSIKEKRVLGVSVDLYFVVIDFTISMALSTDP
jgi:hypothetical protein